MSIPEKSLINHNQSQPSSLVALFPGHGSQEIGMGSQLWQNPDLQDVLDDLLCEIPNKLNDIRLNGPIDILSQNLNLSSVIYITSRLAWEILRRKNYNIDLGLGYSIGQYSALAAANSFSPREGLRLIRKRAELMDIESKKEPQGMLAVVGLSRETIDSIIQQIRDDGHRIYISNINALQHFTVAGSLNSIESASNLFQSKGALRIQKLNVSGAWHSPFMEGAKEEFRNFLETFTFKEPQFKVVSNLSSKPIELKTLKDDLVSHLFEPVSWYTSIKYCIDNGYTHFVEVGHGNLLRKMMQFINRKVVFDNLLQ